MTTFVLVHGAYHGAWCWEPLIMALGSAGHRSVAIDLPIDDPAATWTDHVDAVLEACPPEPAVLVGHSRAGRLMPHLLARATFSHAVYIAASLPNQLGAPPRACDSIPMSTAAVAETGERDHLGRLVCPPERARQLYYHDCAVDTTDWALARLRPQADLDVPAPDHPLGVAGAYIAGIDDRAVNINWMRAAAREVLAQPAIELPAGHTPFLSAPSDVALILDAIATPRPADHRRAQLA